MKIIPRFVLLLAVSVALLGSASPARAGVEGILITASNEPGQTDRRLAPYESTLRRILRFETFRLVGSGRSAVEAPASDTIRLGNGHELAIEAERSDGKGIHLKVRWTAGGRSLMNTGLSLRPGVPAVLGGPPTGSGGDVYAVILVGH